MYDVAVIGAGIVGAACAWRLSRCKLNVVLLEKENDVCMGTTRANSAIIHAGYDPKPGTLMAKLNVRGNALCKEICKKLDVPLKETGSLVLAFDDEECEEVHALFARGQQNGVPGLEIWDTQKILQKEPNVAKNVKLALWAPTAAIVNPWEMGLAMAETAVRNGCTLHRSFPVTKIEKTDGGYTLHSSDVAVRARYVISACGVHADEVRSMVSPAPYKIIPTAGEYYLLDKSEGKTVSSVVFQCPSKKGKGVLVAPTVHGNLIVGPTATLKDDRDDTANTAAGMREIRKKAVKSVPGVNFRQNIRNFSGVRANSTADDFVIEFADKNFLDVAGIRSPGLTAAPAIAEQAAEMLFAAGLPNEEKEHYTDSRTHIHFNTLDEKAQQEIVQKNPLYGRVICRCETVTEGEIVEAIHSPVPPCSVDGIKRRTGTGMGRCQGGFCGPRVLEILARETETPQTEILQDAQDSYILTGETKTEEM